MRYVLSEAIAARSANASMRMNAQLVVSDKGDPELTPVATQWSLEVKTYINGTQGTFDVVENLLRSFLQGKFARENNHPFFEQVNGGFVVRFFPSDTQWLGETNRRDVEKLQLKLELAHPGIGQEEVFYELVHLADFGFSAAINSFEAVAPLVFCGELRAKMASIAPLLRPLKMVLSLKSGSNVFEKFTEGALQLDFSKNRDRQNTRGKSWDDEAVDPSLRRVGSRVGNINKERGSWDSAGTYFAEKKFEYRHFVVLDDCGDDLHEPVFMSSLT